MLQLLDLNKNKIAGLTEYKDLCIESVLETGDKTLSFLYSKRSKYYDEIVEESYIRTKTDEFVVKEKDLQSDYTTFICKLNVEDIEGKEWDRFEGVGQTIINVLNLAIVGTGWTIGKTECSLKKKRTVRKTNCSSWDIIQQIKKTYRVEIEFDTINKKINLYEHLGKDKGTYFIDSLNLKSINIQSNSYDFYTRMIPIGKDGMTIEDINNCKKYVENYQYSNKVKTLIWKDERYTIKENLKDDAIAKLNEISKPYRAYSVELINLAKLNDKYKDVLDYSLGDNITILSKENKIKEKQRIVKLKEYPQDHTRDTVELANIVLRFEDIQQQFEETSDTVDNITTDNGTVDGSTIDSIEVKQIEDFKANVIEVVNLKAVNASIDNLKVIKADIQDLHAVTARIGTLESTTIKTTDLEAVNAKINNLQSNKADINLLNAQGAKINTLESKTANIDNLLAGNLTSNNFKANSIVAGSAIIAENAIGSSQISSLEVNKLEAGDISTSKFRIISANGSIQIVGNQILINRDNLNRVVLGEYRKQDGTTDYGLLIRAKDGKTVMFDGEGVHNAGITDGAINNNKVADNANIAGNKLDINSVIREVNGATETIKGTRVQIGDRTLDVELSTQKNIITGNSKELSTQKSSIQALDKAIKLKVDNQTFTQITNDIKGNINSLNTNLSKHTAELNILKEEINTKVSQSDINKSISEIKLGGRNYYLNSSFKKTLDSWSTSNPKIIIQDGFLIMDARNITESYLDTQQTFNVDGEGYYVMSLEVIESTGTCYMYAIDKNDTDAVQPYHDNCLMLESNKRNFKVIQGRKGTTRFWSVIRAMKGSYLKCRFAKFEKGNKMPTDWTPAPEDMDQLIADNIKVVTDKINTVESTFKQAKDSLQASVNSLSSTTQTITTNLTNRINVAKNEAIVDARTIPDTRSTNESPQWYLQNYRRQTITEFKYAKAVQIPNTINDNNYGTLETKVPWGDRSGGYPTQIFRSNSFPTYQRHGINDTTWSSWEQIEDTNGSQEKANSALNNAKTYTNAQITTVNTRVSNAESSLNILKGQISTKVSQSDIDRTVNNIKIGGRNLIVNSDTLQNLFSTLGGYTGTREVINDEYALCKKDVVFKCTNAGTGFHLPLFGKKPNRIGKTYTWSFWAKCSVNKSGTIGHESNGQIKVKFTTEWKKFTHTWLFGDCTYSSFTFYIGWNIGEMLYIRDFKIEDGTKATDWTPAPEDLQQEIKDNITTVTEKINTVESTFTQKTNNINATVSSVQSILNKKADGSTVSSIQSQLSSLNIGLNGIRTEVSKKTDKNNIISAINQSAEEIKIDASRIKLNGLTTFARNTGIKAIEIDGPIINFYDWEGSERKNPVGNIYSSRTNSDIRKPGLVIGHEESAMFDIVCKDKKTKKYQPYINFDKYNIGESIFPITLYEDISLNGYTMYLGDTKRNYMFQSREGDFCIRTAHGLKILDKDNGSYTADLDANYTGFGKWNQDHFYAKFFPGGFCFSGNDGKSLFWLNDGSWDIWTKKGMNMRIQGDLSVNGKKNRIVETPIGNLALNAMESAECWFTDNRIEQDRTDNNGDCIIWFDKKFLLTVNTKYRYKIDLTPLGEFASNGKLTYVRVVEKTEKYFKVRGTPNTLFDWTITAKQINFENVRLEKFEKAS